MTPCTVAMVALFLTAIGFTSPLWAKDTIAGCAGAHAPFATVEAAGVEDGATLRLADGRRVRLAGVIAPGILDGDAAAMSQAGAALTRLAMGRSLALYGDRDARDRYGRLTAQALAVGIANDPPRWLQSALVRDGMLRVMPGLGEPDCAAALLAAEQEARAARAGLWAAANFAVQEAGAVTALLAATGRFAIVEGTVVRIGEAGGRLFLDFGRRYREAFTIVVPRVAQDAFASAGIDLRALSGKRVRVRGVIYSWGGPAVEIRLPAALELVGADGA